MTELTADERAVLRAADVIRARQAAAATPAPEAPKVPAGLAPTGADLERIREMQRQAEAARKREIADLRALAQSDPSLIPGWTPLNEHTGNPAVDQHNAGLNRSMALAGHEWFRCLECRREIRGDVRLVGGVTICAPCFAAHRLGPCDQCGTTDRDSLRAHFSDGAWRCDSCAADPQPTGARARVIGIRA